MFAPGLVVTKGVRRTLQDTGQALPRLVDGVLIGEGNCCCEEDGSVMSVSRMGVRQLRAELTAKGLETDGLRQTLYRRVQARQ